MKKALTLFIFVIFVVCGFYIFKPKLKEPKFFTQDKILPTDTVVKITNKGFEPTDVSIKKGMRVVWINQISGYVWPASDPHPLHTDYPEFDPKEPLASGEVWTMKFERVGLWGYHNHMKPSQKGRVNVTS